MIFPSTLQPCGHWFCGCCALRWSVEDSGRRCPVCNIDWVSLEYVPHWVPLANGAQRGVWIRATKTLQNEVRDAAVGPVRPQPSSEETESDEESETESDEETETESDAEPETTVRRPMTGAERSAQWRARQFARYGYDFTANESAARRQRRHGP